MEEWEILNENKIQLVVANNGDPIRPVHIVSDLNPRNGAKALFQSEKIIIIRISKGMYEISKNSIDENGEITSNILSMGNYTALSDINFGENFNHILKRLNDVYAQYKGGNYLSPIWFMQ